VVESIHLEGGTMLGTSRTRVDVREVVKRLDLWKIDMLFVVGGPGGHRAALEIQLECGRSRVPCCVVALPKSIDNDMLLLDRTFGYETAVEEAQTALLAAKVEASSGYRGLGLVKLMGRRSGFIAVQASLASGLVDACLIPEVPFRVAALASYLQGVIERKGHAVVCVAEGAALDLMEGPPPAVDGVGRRLSVDAAGRPASKDVGAWLKKELKRAIPDADLKLIDPSYLIRSVPPHSSDRVYCRMLAHGALHAGFAGYTGISVGLVNTQFVYLPIPLVVEAPRLVDPNGELWNRLRSAVGQPDFSHDPADGAPSLGRVASGTIA
jgi:6-phosphofructokinase 1